MKAALLTAPGVPVFADVQRPATSDPIIDVTLAGINPFDVVMSRMRQDTPVVPGFEGVGRYQGRRVYFRSGLGRHGALAEQAVAKTEDIIDIADGVSDEMALVLGTPGLTAYLGLLDGGGMKPGETVLVLGASGIVGRLAVQIARHQGASRVIAAARNLAVVKDLPVDASVSLVDATDVEALARTFREAGPPDLVLDMLWGVPGVAALKAMARGGRQIQIGNAAGGAVEFSPQFMRLNQTQLIGYSSGLPPAARRSEAYGALCTLARAGVVHAPTKVLPLSNIAEAWAAQSASPNLKLCIDVTA